MTEKLFSDADVLRLLPNVTSLKELQQRLDRLAQQYVTVSLCYGPAIDGSCRWSVDVLTKDCASFDLPFAAETLGDALKIAEVECHRRGWA